ncbi:MAG: hypothetical protein KAT70_06905, partial [Thermoplasmata archaeon]|nr:hypothetical protein [Thermoplasmata archaeon]
MDEFEQILLAIAGVGPARIRALLEAGFDTAEKLGAASVEELAAVRGISRNLAERMHGAFVVEEKKEDKPSLFLCPECGAFMAEGATRCEICGTEFEEEEGEEEGSVETPEAAEELAKAPDEEKEKEEGVDGYWYKEEPSGLFLCPQCGAFITKGASKCDICGAEFEEVEEEEAEESVEDIERELLEEAKEVQDRYEEKRLREEGVDGYW